MIVSCGLRYRYTGGAEIGFPDFVAQQGDTVLLRGDSGTGKSTWLALAAGLRRATAGDMVVAGQPLNALRPAACDAWRARTLGFLPQKLHLSEALTVYGNLALVYFAAGLPPNHAAITQTLAVLGLAELAQRKPAQLSGGQAQRVALARAVLLNPQVLLADEPTASLDDAAAASALQLMQATAARCGATLVVATHDARVAQALPGAKILQLSSQIGTQPLSGMGEQL